MSQITTHILDTSLGKPASGVSIQLQSLDGQDWNTIGKGKTNKDGRVPDLLSPGTMVSPGTYRMVFETAAYFQQLELKTFYPDIKIEFLVSDQSHYHIPLLLNPFGYSTYRGS